MVGPKCVRCCENDRYFGIFYFAYKKILFTTASDGLTCKKCCKKEFEDIFEKFGAEIIKRIDGKSISVNWENYKKFPIGADHFKINRLLEALGVFSCKPESHYEIATHDGKIFNPKSSFAGDARLFFKKMDDAIDYVQMVLHPQIENYAWEIRKISKVLSHTDFHSSKNRAA